MNDIQARPLSAYTRQDYQPTVNKEKATVATPPQKADERPAVLFSFVSDLMEAHRYVQNRRTAAGS